MELRHLRYFLAVAEELHFGRAAQKLQMTQPPLSQQIQALEDELGVCLFHRTKRTVQLSAAGKQLQQDAQQILKQVEQAKESAQRVHRGEVGRLILGAVGTATFYLLPTLLDSFRQTYPHVKVIIKEMTTGEQITALQNGVIDLGILRPPLMEPTIQVVTLAKEPLIAALNPQHPLAQQEQISISALVDESFILFPRPFGPGLYDCIMLMCQQASFIPKVSQEAVQMTTIMGLVSVGMGISLLPASVQVLTHPRVIFRPLLEQTVQVQMGLAWLEGQKTPIVHNFIELT